MLKTLFGRVNISSINISHHEDDLVASGAGKILALYDFFILVVGLFGNSLVLYGLKRYQAIQIDKISMIFIESLTYSEIMILILHNVPIFLSLIFKQWLLGPLLCYILAFVTPMAFVVEIFTLVGLTCNRVRILKNTQNRILQETMQTDSIRVVVNLIWISGIAYIFVLMFGIQNNYAIYQPERLRCAPANFSNPRHKVFNNILTTLVVFIPLLIIVVSNFYILICITKFRLKQKIRIYDLDGPRNRSFLDIIKKMSAVENIRGNRAGDCQTESHGSSYSNRSSAALTILLICLVFTASYLPLITFVILQSGSVNLPAWFSIYFTHSLSFNIAFNPLIYACTNRRFRLFLVDKLRVESTQI